MAVLLLSVTALAHTASIQMAQAHSSNSCKNLAITHVKASGSQSAHPPKNTIGNNLDSRWSNFGLGSWIQADLGAQKVICNVDIAFYKGNERHYNFVVSVSSEGTNFTDIFTGRSSGRTLSLEKYDFPDVIAKYIKITVNGNTQNNYASITDIDIYGKKRGDDKGDDKSYKVNVLVIEYFPLTPDGTIDFDVTGEEILIGVTYDIIKEKTTGITNKLPSVLGEASTYLGYKSSSAKPALRYHISDVIEHRQPVPISPRPDNPIYPDYNGIMRAHDICDYVDNKNIDEVWLWAYQGFPDTKLGILESKMSGPFGDISNSPRYNDMPRCKNTYIVYTFNYARGLAEAFENWSHQLEAQLTAVDVTFIQNQVIFLEIVSKDLLIRGI